MKQQIRWNSRYLDILAPVILRITGKKIRVGKECFKQTDTHIYGTTWMELNHELAHWLVATEEERKLPNIGYTTNQITLFNYEQEILASRLNQKLNELFPMNHKEYNYSVYVGDTRTRLPLEDEYQIQIWEDNKDRIMSLPEVKKTFKLIEEQLAL